MYKSISKCLIDKLVVYMDELVSPYQVAFIKEPTGSTSIGTPSKHYQDPQISLSPSPSPLVVFMDELISPYHLLSKPAWKIARRGDVVLSQGVVNLWLREEREDLVVERRWCRYWREAGILHKVLDAEERAGRPVVGEEASWSTWSVDRTSNLQAKGRSPHQGMTGWF